jgi:hypothetical protein
MASIPVTAQRRFGRVAHGPNPSRHDRRAIGARLECGAIVTAPFHSHALDPNDDHDETP